MSARPVATASDGGFLLVLAIFVPVAGLLASFALGGRIVERSTPGAQVCAT